ncbi:MAG: NAD(P)/FAD-dependent oxidoreductase, partial [Pseudomonadota bacterium]
MTDSIARRNDVIVIGAGHNGLVCANYLARSGLNVLILEANDAAGGMAAPRSLGSDYRFPGLAHVGYPLGNKIRNDLNLDQFGFQPSDAIDTISLDPGGSHVRIGADTVAGVGESDQAAFAAFKAEYREFAGALAPLMSNKPPRLKDMEFADKVTLAKLGWKLRIGLGKDSMYEFLRVAAINIYDVLNERFDNDLLKGAIALDAVLGNSMGPRTPGTVLTWLQKLTGEQDGPLGCHAGPGLVNALTQSAEDAGVMIRYGARVAKVLIENDRAFGVELDNGDLVKAPRVVSNLDPRVTFGSLVGAPRLDAMFANRVQQIRGNGVVGRLNLALSGLPEFTGVESAQLRNRLVVAPSMRYVEHAFNHSKYGEVSDTPAFEILMPSLHDNSLAPNGHHVMSVNVSFLPCDSKSGWSEQSATLAYRLLSQLSEYAPNLKTLVVDHELLAPPDVESEFGAKNGHWHHGELSIHQSFMMRPVYGAAQ